MAAVRSADKRDVTWAQWPGNRCGQDGAKTHIRGGLAGTFPRRDAAIGLKIVDFSAHRAYISGQRTLGWRYENTPERLGQDARFGCTVERDFDMSNELLDALEFKLLTAVETIESQRREIDELKEERRLMEDKLRGLIGRIDQVGGEPLSEPVSSSVTEETPQPLDRPMGSYNGPANPYRRPDPDY